LLWLGEAQHRAGDPKAAARNLERAQRLREANDDPNSPWLAVADLALAACLVDQGETRPARVLLAKASAIQVTQHELGNYFKAPLTELEQRLGRRSQGRLSG
jgi:ATP/maltotriose-dependent transcriptional regulator MalT